MITLNFSATRAFRFRNSYSGRFETLQGSVNLRNPYKSDDFGYDRVRILETYPNGTSRETCFLMDSIDDLHCILDMWKDGYDLLETRAADIGCTVRVLKNGRAKMRKAVGENIENGDWRQI